MDLALYHKTLLVPAKCGTRYIDGLLGVNSQLNTQFHYTIIEERNTHWLDEMLNTDIIKIIIPSEDLVHYHKLPITHIVLREPMGLLEAALHTELSGHHTTIISEGGGFVSTNSLLIERLLTFTTTGNGHYSPHLYKGIWDLLQIRPDIQIIPLNELSRFLTLNGLEDGYINTDWNFSSVSSRVELMKSVKSVFPQMWSVINTLTERDSIYYDYICDGKRLELPMVEGLPKKGRRLI